jgi:metal-sulfur cluster biosynthetic enzyme
MSEATVEIESEVRRLLDSIGDPCSVAQGVPMGIGEMGLLDSVDADAEGNVAIHLRLTSPACMMVGYFKVEAERLARTVDGVRTVTISSDTGLDWRPEMISAAAQERRRQALRERGAPDLTPVGPFDAAA